MANIAAISVIATSTVALGTPLINARLTALLSKRTARSERLDELRSVLDAGAVALMAFMGTMADLDKPHGTLTFETIELHLPEMRARLQIVWNEQARIAVRLGTLHPVYKAYEAAHDAAGSYLMTLREVVATRAGGKLSLRELVAEQEAAYGNFMNVAATITGLDRS